MACAEGLDSACAMSHAASVRLSACEVHLYSAPRHEILRLLAAQLDENGNHDYRRLRKVFFLQKFFTFRKFCGGFVEKCEDSTRIAPRCIERFLILPCLHCKRMRRGDCDPVACHP